MNRFTPGRGLGVRLAFGFLACASLLLHSSNLSAAVDLVVSSSDTPDPADPNGTITYLVRVVNSGSTSATAVTLTDTVSSNASIKSIVSSGTCTGSGNTRTCSLGALAAGNTATVTVEVTAPSAGTVTNSVSATSTPGDTKTSDNSTSESTTVLGGLLEGIELSGEFEDVETVCSEKNEERCRFRGAFRVRNEGNETPTTFTVGIVFSKDEEIDNEDYLLTFKRGVVKPGRSYLIRWNEKLRPGKSVTDSYLIAVIDPKNEVEEIDEDNNFVTEGPLE